MVKMNGTKFIGAKFLHLPADKRDTPFVKKNLMSKGRKNRQKTPERD